MFTNRQLLRKILLLLICGCLIIVLTRLGLRFDRLVNSATLGFSFLVVVVLSAIFAGMEVAILTSIFATLFLNYFFLPPIGTFHIADIDNWVTVSVLLFTAIVISRLTASAHQSFREKENLQINLKQLNDFSTWILSVPQDLVTLSAITENAVRIFRLEYCSIHVYAEGKWHHYSGTSVGDLSQQVTEHLKLMQDHPTGLRELVEEQALAVSYYPIRSGPELFAVLATRGGKVTSETLETIASVTGILLSNAQTEKRLSALQLEV